jgi:hypothetical protein
MVRSGGGPTKATICGGGALRRRGSDGGRGWRARAVTTYGGRRENRGRWWSILEKKLRKKEEVKV